MLVSPASPAFSFVRSYVRSVVRMSARAHPTYLQVRERVAHADDERKGAAMLFEGQERPQLQQVAVQGCQAPVPESGGALGCVVVMVVEVCGRRDDVRVVHPGRRQFSHHPPSSMHPFVCLSVRPSYR